MQKLDFDFYFKESFGNVDEDDRNRLCATGLITPIQNIQVLNIPDRDAKFNYTEGFGFHHDTLTTIFSEMFNIDINNEAWNFDKDDEVDKVVKNRDMNYVFLRYIHYDESSSYVNVTIPRFITPYQYDELCKLNEIYKNYDNVQVEAGVTTFNPITSKSEEIDMHIFEGDYGLDRALEFIKDNNRIKEYDSPIKNEQIIKYSEKTFK